LRNVIHDYYVRTEGLEYSPVDEIIVSVGAMEGLYLAMMSILDPGDEVIIPAPYYVNYVQMCEMCHAVPVIVDNPIAEELSFNLEDVAAAITPKTKAIMLNSPSNPSGKIIPYEKLVSISELAIKHNLVVISDEVYKSLIYDDYEYKSIASIDGMRERTILVNSLSKEFCMTGWRIGYVLGPSEVITAMTKLQENIVACAPLPSQYAAMEALSGNGDYSSEMVEIFRSRRNVLTEGIKSIGKLSCVAPDATFYLMVNISETGMNSEEFAFELLKKEHVALVPGITYGKCCDNYVRIAFTVEEDVINEGVRRIKRFIENL
jgi:aminotransferase